MSRGLPMPRDIGHRVGWTLLDESTFVVDFRIVFEILQVVFEITRPAAYFAPFHFGPDYTTTKHRLHTLTLKNKKGDEIMIPMPGV